MKVITLLNEKGGVAKTTTAVTVAAGLALKGWRVLLVDTDPQGHATVSLGLPKMDGLLRLLAQDGEWSELTARIEPARWAGSYALVDGPPLGTLDVLPSHLNNRALPMLLDGHFLYFRERLGELDGEVDAVVIDTAPTPSMIHGLVYLASHHILFPTTLEYLSLDGLASSTQNMMRGNEARKQYGLPPINPLGVLPVMVEEITNNHRHNMDRVQANFGADMVWAPIMKRTIWRTAVQRAETIFAFAANHPAEQEAWTLVERVEKAAS